MNKRGHGPIDFTSKGFSIVVGVLLLKFASDGVLIPEAVAILLGAVLIFLSILAFFG